MGQGHMTTMGGSDEQPVTVKNKDIPLLSSLLAIMQDIAWLEERERWRRERMFSVTQNLSGMPHQSGGLPRGIDDKLAAVDIITEQIEEDTRKMRQAESILYSIQSPTMRAFVIMRYIMKVPGVKIRGDLAMTRRGFDIACLWVEEAPSMAAVTWRDDYVLKKEPEEDV